MKEPQTEHILFLILLNRSSTNN